MEARKAAKSNGKADQKGRIASFFEKKWPILPDLLRHVFSFYTL
jgi:hypothetical protein